MTKHDREQDAEYPLGPALDFLQRLWRLNHALEKVSRRMEVQLGVTAQQRFILRCIGKYPGLTAGQLASLLHVDPGTVSTSLNRLEKRDLLERRRDSRDKRRIAIGLTAAGRALDRPAHGTVEAAVEQLLRNAASNELTTMSKVLDDLTQLLEAGHASERPT